ncbi:phosphatidate cytidylyltransferase [Sphingomonas prati]|nr:phosphatidate cytidylyltransferase [Sphingomonas prati]GGE72881.1 phosphatidate cytidylyltransferase [Sphingomonas prati]
MTVVPGQTPARRRSDLATRALAGAAMIFVAVGALALGGTAFWLLAVAAAGLMLAEWAGLMRSSSRRIVLALVLFSVPMLFLMPAVGGANRDTIAILVACALLVMVVGNSGRLGMGLLYVGLPTAGLLFLRGQPAGIGWTLWTLAIVWATDIGAYFSGRAIGGRKLAPRLSPNKTWAGLFGGMAGALIVGGLIAWIAGLPTACLWLGPPLAVLAQIGDLFESWLKRRAGVKDSGRLLPGHGGALDRLDGVVPVAVLVSGLVAGGVL